MKIKYPKKNTRSGTRIVSLSRGETGKSHPSSTHNKGPISQTDGLGDLLELDLDRQGETEQLTTRFIRWVAKVDRSHIPNGVQWKTVITFTFKMKYTKYIKFSIEVFWDFSFVHPKESRCLLLFTPYLSN